MTLNTKEVYRGPGGIKLILDPSEIFPEDPGQGCPALVDIKGDTSSYNCALGEGMVDDKHTLTQGQFDWLISHQTTIDKMYDSAKV